MKLEISLDVERRLGDPQIKIMIDDYLTLADGPSQNVYTFDINIPNESHVLKIIHYGKTIDDHEYDATGQVSVDKHVEIVGIAMDDVPLQNELWLGKFFPVYLHKADNEPYLICPNLYLGHNGTWQLEFVTPARLWLINRRRHGPNLEGTIFKTNREVLESAKNFFQGLPDV